MNYRSRPIAPRKRRSTAEMHDLLGAITGVLGNVENVITVRHLFYRLVGLGAIPKTESQYKSLVHHLSIWRRNGQIPWNAFADSTRWHIRTQTFDGLEDALRHTRQIYRRDLWSTQPSYVEVWVEKDAVASIIQKVTTEFDVPLFVCRGFASLSSLYGAAQTFKSARDAGKSLCIFHLGDYDPSGHAAADAIERTMVYELGCYDLDFVRLAISREQIDQFHLPTRPRKESDKRSAKWHDDECVELDSMPPSELKEIVRNAIGDLIDPFQWQALQQVEAAERESLAKIRIAA